MPAKWQTVRVFISSTFQDMHAGREELVKYVFPELRHDPKASRKIEAEPAREPGYQFSWGALHAPSIASDQTTEGHRYPAPDTSLRLSPTADNASCTSPNHILCSGPPSRMLRAAYIFDIKAWMLLLDHLHCLWEMTENDGNFSKRCGR